MRTMDRGPYLERFFPAHEVNHHAKFQTLWAQPNNLHCHVEVTTYFVHVAVVLDCIHASIAQEVHYLSQSILNEHDHGSGVLNEHQNYNSTVFLPIRLLGPN